MAFQAMEGDERSHMKENDGTEADLKNPSLQCQISFPMPDVGQGKVACQDRDNRNNAQPDGESCNRSQFLHRQPPNNSIPGSPPSVSCGS